MEADSDDESRIPMVSNANLPMFTELEGKQQITLKSSSQDLFHTVEVPDNFQTLKQNASQLFSLAFDTIELRDVLGRKINDSNFKELKSNVVLVFNSNEPITLNPQTFKIDITPSKTILTKGGNSEYDLVSAVCELVDNSIQALRQKTEKRQIQIRFKSSPESNGTIFVWDNGKGMNLQDLKRWATMGLTQADYEDQVPESAKEESSHRGYISRFGVGSKKAAFFLGKKVTVKSRVVDSDWVATVEMSADGLKDSGKDWTTTISLSEPTGKDINRKSFTAVKITNLNFRVPSGSDDDDLELKRKMAHIYYYYTHAKNDPYEIRLNGVTLANVADDMESLYLLGGQNEKSLSFSVKVSKTVSIPCRLKLLYFPFEEGEETMPIQLTKDSKDKDDGQIPLELRNPGIELFWNDRLIPGAQMPLLGQFGFTNGGVFKSTKLEKQWFLRVKAMLFVNELFPVTHTKMHFVKDDEIAKAVFSFSEAKTQTLFREWLLNSHLTLDKEIEFHGIKNEKNETIAEAFSRGSEKISLKDYVVLKSKSIVGQLTKILFSGSLVTADDAQCVLNVDGTEETIPLSRIKGKATKEQYNKYIQTLKLKNPKSLKFFAGEKTPLPPDTLVSGEVIPWISFVLYDGNTKFVEKPILDSLKPAINLTVTHIPTKQKTYNQTFDSQYQTARYSKKSITGFELAGEYSLFVSTEIKGQILSDERKLIVLPSRAVSIIAKFQGKETEKVRLSTAWPTIVIEQRDSKDNMVPFSGKIPDLGIDCVTKSDIPSVPVDLGAQWNTEMKDGFLYISNIIPVTTQFDVLPVQIEIDIDVGGLKTTIRSNLHAGPPHAFRFVGDPFNATEPTVINKSLIPPFVVQLVDQFNNVTEPSGCQLTIESLAFKKPKKMKVDAAELTIEDLKVNHQPAQDSAEKNKMIVTFILTDKKEELIRMPVVLKVLPSKFPSTLKLQCPEALKFTIREDGSYDAKFVAGGSYQMILQILDDSGEPLENVLGSENKVNLSWVTQGDLEIVPRTRQMDLETIACIASGESGKILLPSFQKRETGKHSESVKWKFPPNNNNNTAGRKKKSNFLDVQVHVDIHPGKPTNFAADLSNSNVIKVRDGEDFQITVFVVDTLGNRITEASSLKNILKAKSCPQLRTSSEGQSELVDAQLSEFNPETCSWSLTAKFVGAGKLAFAVEDMASMLAKSVLYEVEIMKLPATELRVNGEKSIEIDLHQQENVTLTFTSTDKNGQMVSVTQEVRLKCDELATKKLFTNLKKIKLNGGQETFQSIVQAPPGRYTIVVEPIEIKLEKCVVVLNVQPSLLEQTEIEFVQISNTYKAGTEASISFRLKDTNGNSLPTGIVTSASVTVDSTAYRQFQPKDDVITIHGVRFPAKTGKTELSVKVKANNVDIVKKGIMISVVADVPARLISANNEIETIPGESFELKIDVLDKCDNIVDSFNGEAQLVLNEIAESYALLNGSSKTKLQNGQAVFQLSASMNTKCPTGVYPIEISLVGIQLAPVIVSLRFENASLNKVNVESRQKRMSLAKRKEELSSQQRPIQQNLRDLEVKLTNIRYEIDQMRDKLIKEVKTIQPNLSVNLSNPSDYVDLKQMLEKGLEDLNTQPVRTPQKPSHLVNLSSKPPQGLVGVFCDLAFIDDPQEAELLSKILLSKMNVLVFDNSDNSSLFLSANKQSKEGFQVISPDVASPWRGKDNGNGKLFGPLNGPTEGFLGHMIDRIKMRADLEPLRKNVFYSLIGDITLWDTEAHAMAYRKWSTSQGKQTGTLMYLQEMNYLEKSGLRKTGGQQNSKQSISLMFGQRPVQEGRRFKAYRTCLSKIDDIVNAYKNYEDTEMKRNEIEGQVTDFQNEISELDSAIIAATPEPRKADEPPTKKSKKAHNPQNQQQQQQQPQFRANPPPQQPQQQQQQHPQQQTPDSNGKGKKRLSTESEDPFDFPEPQNKKKKLNNKST